MHSKADKKPAATLSQKRKQKITKTKTVEQIRTCSSTEFAKAVPIT